MGNIRKELKYTQKHQKHYFSFNKNRTLSFGEFFFILCIFVVFGFLFVFVIFVCLFFFVFFGSGAFSRVYIFFFVFFPIFCFSQEAG